MLFLCPFSFSLLLLINSDYLELIHGFYHVDGDLPLRTMADQPEMKAVVKKWFFEMRPAMKEKEGTDEKRKDLVSKDYEGYEAYWGPYQQVLVDNALQAAKTHEKVVITFAQPYNICREYVITKLKEGGATNVIMMYLTIDQDTKLEGLYHRAVQQAKGMGMSLSESMREDWKHDRDPTKEEYKKLIDAPGKPGDLYPFEPPPSYAKIVDVSSRDKAAMDAIDVALGLHRASVCTEPYDTIVTKVRAMDVQRDKDTPYCVSAIFPELKKEMEEALALAKTEDEKVHIKRRASSIVEFELKNRLSCESTFSFMVFDEDEDGDGDSNTEKSQTSDAMKLRKNRRSSFIRTGKIE